MTRSKGKEAWYFPGGKREVGESDESALIREIKEELTTDLRPETIRLFGKFKAQAHGKPEGVFVQNTCYFSEFSGEFKPSAEIEEIAYLDSSIDKKLLTPVGIIIFDELKRKNMIV